MWQLICLKWFQTAKPEKLWDILADLKSWPKCQWTSCIESISSDQIKQGTTFVAELGGVKWNMTVTKAQRPQRICWEGRRLGLKAVHDWEFIEQEEETNAVTRESMSGWMLILLYPVVKMRLLKGDAKWLADLKSRAESKSP